MALCKGLYETLDSIPGRARDRDYEDEQLCRSVALRTVMYANSLAQQDRFECSGGELARLSQLLPFIREGRLTVLDFGGGCGAHYHVFRRLLAAHGLSAEVNWVVCETPGMVQAAQCSVSRELSFTTGDELEQVSDGAFDVIFACGSLQYTPDPMHYLARLVGLGAEGLFVTRTPMLAGEWIPPVYSMQQTRLSENGPGPVPPNLQDRLLSYPVCFAHYADYEAVLQAEYTVVADISEEQSGYVLQEAGVEIPMRGMLCRRSD